MWGNIIRWVFIGIVFVVDGIGVCTSTLFVHRSWKEKRAGRELVQRRRIREWQLIIQPPDPVTILRVKLLSSPDRRLYVLVKSRAAVMCFDYEAGTWYPTALSNRYDTWESFYKVQLKHLLPDQQAAVIELLLRLS